jgi:hypothetical protein
VKLVMKADDIAAVILSPASQIYLVDADSRAAGDSTQTASSPELLSRPSQLPVPQLPVGGLPSAISGPPDPHLGSHRCGRLWRLRGPRDAGPTARAPTPGSPGTAPYIEPAASTPPVDRIAWRVDPKCP